MAGASTDHLRMGPGLAAGIPGFPEEAELQVQAQQGEYVTKIGARVESQFAHQVVGVVLLGRCSGHVGL